MQYGCLLSPVLDQKITLHNALTLCQFHSTMIMTLGSDVEEVRRYPGLCSNRVPLCCFSVLLQLISKDFGVLYFP